MGSSGISYYGNRCGLLYAFKLVEKTALVVDKLQVVDAQRAVEVLTSTAAKKNSADETMKYCYFEAHAREVAAANETSGAGEPDFLDK